MVPGRVGQQRACGQAAPTACCPGSRVRPSASPTQRTAGRPETAGPPDCPRCEGWCSSHLGSWGGLDLTRAPKACPCAKWVQLPSLRSKCLQSCRSQGPTSWLTASTSRLLSNTRSAKSFSAQLFQSNSGSVCLAGASHWGSRAISPSETAPQLHRSDRAPSGDSPHTGHQLMPGVPWMYSLSGRAASAPCFLPPQSRTNPRDRFCELCTPAPIPSQPRQNLAQSILKPCPALQRLMVQFPKMLPSKTFCCC